MSFYAGKKVLVTGAAGLLGSHVVASLLDKGAEIYANVHSTSDVPENVTVVQNDLLDLSACLKAAKGMDIILHCAAVKGGAGAFKDNPTQPVLDTIRMTQNMLEASVKSDVTHFGLVSSTTVYPLSDEFLAEEDMNGSEPYEGYLGIGWMNLYMEKLAKYFVSACDLNVSVIRLSNIYGPRDSFDPEKCNVIPATIRKGVEGLDPFPVWGDGTAVRDFIYVADAAEGFLNAVYMAPNADPINIASGQKITVTELVETVIRVCDYDPKIEYDATKPTAISKRMINTKKAEKVLNFKAQTSLEDGLRQTVKWYREQEND